MLKMQVAVVEDVTHSIIMRLSLAKRATYLPTYLHFISFGFTLKGISAIALIVRYILRMCQSPPMIQFPVTLTLKGEVAFYFISLHENFLAYVFTAERF